MAFGTVVDSNVLLDLFSEDPTWADWSAAQLAAAFDRGPVVINPVVDAEISLGFARIEDLDAALPARAPAAVSRGHLPRMTSVAVRLSRRPTARRRS